MLKLSQLTSPLCEPGEDNAVVKPVGLTLPELDHVGLDNVAPPVSERQVEYLLE